MAKKSCLCIDVRPLSAQPPPPSRLCYRCYKLIEVELLQSKQNIINGAHFDSLHGSEQRTRLQTMNNVKIDVLYLILEFIAVFAFNSQFISDKESKR